MKMFKDPYDVFEEAKGQGQDSWSSKRPPSYIAVKKAMRFKRLLWQVPVALVTGIVIWILAATNFAALGGLLIALGICGAITGVVFGIGYLVEQSVKYDEVLENAQKMGISDDA